MVCSCNVTAKMPIIIYIIISEMISTQCNVRNAQTTNWPQLNVTGSLSIHILQSRNRRIPPSLSHCPLEF